MSFFVYTYIKKYLRECFMKMGTFLDKTGKPLPNKIDVTSPPPANVKI